MKPPSNPDAIKESGGNQKPSTRRKRATSNYESGIGDLVCFIIALSVSFTACFHITSAQRHINKLNILGVFQNLRTGRPSLQDTGGVA